VCFRCFITGLFFIASVGPKSRIVVTSPVSFRQRSWILLSLPYNSDRMNISFISYPLFFFAKLEVPKTSVFRFFLHIFLNFWQKRVLGGDGILLSNTLLLCKKAPSCSIMVILGFTRLV